MFSVPFPSVRRRLFASSRRVAAATSREGSAEAAVGRETSREAITLHRRRRWLAAFRTALYLAAAAMVLNTFMNRWGFRPRSPRYGFKALIVNGGHRPFVYRVLTPAVVRGVTRLLPASRLEGIVEWDLTRPLEDHPSLSAHRRFAWGPRPMAEEYVAYGLLWGIVFLLLMAMRRLAHLAKFPDALADWAPVVILLAVPLAFSRGGYLYDFPELLLLTLATGLLFERRWLLYYACFALACLNKETAILLVVYWLAFHWGNVPRRQVTVHSLAHALIGVPILAWQRITFVANPGAGAELQLWDNLRFLTSPEPWIRFWDPYGPLLPFPGPFNVITIVLFAATMFLFWREKPPRLRRAFVAMMAVLGPLFILFGTLDEVRNFSLAFPLAYLLACHTAARLYGLPPAAAS